MITHGSPEVTTFFHQDVLGNVVMLTDSAGDEVESYRYEVWGGFEATQGGTAITGDPISRFLFTGREWDAELGIYHYRARAYSPELGRFLQQDPIDFNSGDINLSRYVSNVITSRIDPLGLDDLNLLPRRDEHENRIADRVDRSKAYKGDYTVAAHGEPGQVYDSNFNPISVDKLADLIKKPLR